MLLDKPNPSWLLSSLQDGESQDSSAKLSLVLTLLDFLAAFKMVYNKTLLSKPMKLGMIGISMRGFIPTWTDSHIMWHGRDPHLLYTESSLVSCKPGVLYYISPIPALSVRKYPQWHFISLLYWWHSTHPFFPLSDTHVSARISAGLAAHEWQPIIWN